MSLDARNLSLGFWSHTNVPVQLQKNARIFLSKKKKSCENKNADQLCSYCTADLCLCFRIGENPVFSRCNSYNILPDKVVVECKTKH